MQLGSVEEKHKQVIMIPLIAAVGNKVDVAKLKSKKKNAGKVILISPGDTQIEAGRLVGW